MTRSFVDMNQSTLSPAVSTCRLDSPQRNLHHSLPHTKYTRLYPRKKHKCTRIFHSKNNRTEEQLAVFDGEDGWDGEALQGSFMNQALASVNFVADRLTQIAMEFVPESASYEVVKISVIGGLLLVILSCVKGILSFVLTIGTIIFGAYVSVKVFGIDVSKSTQSTRVRKQGKRKPTRSRQRTPQDPPAPGQFLLTTVRDLLSQSTDDENEGLIDVTFSNNNSKKKKNM